MVDDATRTAWQVALETAMRDRDRANATVSFFAEKLGMAVPSEAVVLGPGEPEAEVEGARNVGPVPVTDGEFYGMSQPKAAAAFLERAGRSRPQRTEAVMAALRKGGIEFGGKEPTTSFYTILQRNPLFHNVGKSTWGLSMWYPHAAKKGKSSTGATLSEDAGSEPSASGPSASGPSAIEDEMREDAAEQSVE